ncbi:unnamed protein product [Cuscuta epithymum]|uniref:Uncharacterized protein n=1 Tax=Cuscuta epithymum TaxID=186058 RepID=A0AAV0CNT6_9ASTE|nr:unnamed protein product [Cuscuta epithymum]
MATTPQRPPQLLHNFHLPRLNWGHNSTSNHRFRRRDSSRSMDDSRVIPPKENVNHHRSSTENGGPDSELLPTGSYPLFSSPPCSAGKHRARIPNGEETQQEEQNGAVEIPDEGETRTWNLRPRKASAAASFRNGEMQEVEEGNHSADNKKLLISLSKEEIEEDVYSLTGSRPARRPKKRPRNVQKLLNNVFPGIYLVGLSAASYRAHESQM